jgi:hypothetical protein
MLRSPTLSVEPFFCTQTVRYCGVAAEAADATAADARPATTIAVHPRAAADPGSDLTLPITRRDPIAAG